MPNTHKFDDYAMRPGVMQNALVALMLRKERALDEIVSCRLAELRKALGVTQSELAEMIGKSQSAVSQFEHGEIGLSLETLRSIVRQLGGEIEITAVFDNRRVLIDA